MRSTAAILLSLLLPAGASLAQAPRLIIDEDFNTLDPALWNEATNGRWQTGAPSSTELTRIDGRSVLLMRSRLNGPERRGYLWLGTFPMRRARIEVDFMPISGPGAPLETWILFPYGDAFIAAGPATSADGQRSHRLETTGELFSYGPPPTWEYKRWYRAVYESTAVNFHARLEDAAGTLIWSQSYPWLLCYHAPEWNLGPIQFLESGEGELVSAVDRIRVTLGCGADLNDDGRLDTADFIAFTTRWHAQSCAADMDDNRTLNVTDFVLFQQAFAAGCP
jgi:hypothetical protein